jgi:hypothetical protein
MNRRQCTLLALAAVLLFAAVCSLTRPKPAKTSEPTLMSAGYRPDKSTAHGRPVVDSGPNPARAREQILGPVDYRSGNASRRCDQSIADLTGILLSFQSHLRREIFRRRPVSYFRFTYLCVRAKFHKARLGASVRLNISTAQPLYPIYSFYASSDQIAHSFPLGSVKWNRRPPGNEKISLVTLPFRSITR